MRKTVSLIGAAALGAGIGYLADPTLGKRRRALAGDAVVHGAKVLRKAIDIAARDAAHRLKGFLAVSKQVFKHEHVSDEVLEDRIRTAVGSVSSHPHVEVIVEEGCVTLLGPVAVHEELRVLAAAQSVRGVRAIVNRMQAYKRAAEMPTQTPRQMDLDILRRHWAPATRVVIGSIGISILAGATKMRTAGRMALGAGGLALIARAATNMEFERLLGFKAGPRSVGIQKTIRIAAPIDHVYSVWIRYENFPLFMSRIREVNDLGHSRSHWIVDGPLGTQLEWDAIITEMIPNKVISWRSEPGSLVRHAGTVHFDSEGDYTRVQIHLSYTPPGGSLGHLLATVVGSNPKREMDEDLVRMQTFIETGKRPHDAARQRRKGTLVKMRPSEAA